MENEEIVSNPTWIDEGWQKALDILNQPFIIAIIVAVIIGVFLVILFRSSSLGKKSIQRQDDKIEAQNKSQKDFIDYAKNHLNEQDKATFNFKTSMFNDFKNFVDKENGFKKLTLNCLGDINNINVKKKLEDYNNGKEQETKDNQATGENL